MTQPRVEIEQNDGETVAVLHGDWTLRSFGASLPELRHRLEAMETPDRWDLCQVINLDSTGALILSRAWRRTLPERAEIRPEHQGLFQDWLTGESTNDQTVARHQPTPEQRWIDRLARPTAVFVHHLVDAVEVLGRLTLDSFYFLRHPSRIPWAHISATIYQTGARALILTGLVGFLIGLVIAYQSVLQLQSFGVESFIVTLLSFSVSRELGPFLAAILVAGRSGSAMTARIGVMRVTQELDALHALGISHTRRIVFPMVAGLTIALPLLTIWTDILALFGGMLAARFSLNIGFEQFLLVLPETLPIFNLWLGLGKAAIFGALIGMTAAHFGLRIKPNTESLGENTTNAVVTSITLVIVLDAIASIIFRNTGFN